MPFIKDLEKTTKSDREPFSMPAASSAVNQKRIDFLFDNDIYDLPDSERPKCHENGHSYKSMYGRLHPSRPAQTITTGFGSMGQGRYVHPTMRRLITPHEAARIQGFPDFFDFSLAYKATALRKLIGNAVPPILSAAIVHRLLQGE
jgi:DNA (cytosine-5)-methyltransferase 1